MKTAIINKNWLVENSLRLDSGLYLSEGIITLKSLKRASVPTKTLGILSKDIFYGARAKRYYVSNPERGLPFIKGADISKSSFSNLKFISKKRTPNINTYFLEKDWILVTRSGSIGNTVYVNQDFVGKAASDDIIRIIPDENILSGFLYAYLSSKQGNSLITKGTYGAVIQHIEPEHIHDLLVPIFPKEKQQEIHDLVIEAANLRVKANKLIESTKRFFDIEKTKSKN